MVGTLYFHGKHGDAVIKIMNDRTAQPDPTYLHGGVSIGESAKSAGKTNSKVL